MRPQIKWNIKAFQQLRRSAGVKNRLKSEAESIARSAGSGYVVNTGEGKTRSRASVITGDYDSIRDNSKNNTLLRALGNRGR